MKKKNKTERTTKITAEELAKLRSAIHGAQETLLFLTGIVHIESLSVAELLVEEKLDEVWK